MTSNYHIEKKKHLLKQVVSISYTLVKSFFTAATFEGLRVVSLQS